MGEFVYIFHLVYNLALFIPALAQFPLNLVGLKTFVAHIDIAYRTDLVFNVEWLYGALSNLPPTILEIEVNITTDYEECDKIDWDRIGETIECKSFKHLRSITQTLEFRSGDTQWIQRTRKLQGLY